MGSIFCLFSPKYLFVFILKSRSPEAEEKLMKIKSLKLKRDSKIRNFSYSGRFSSHLLFLVCAHRPTCWHIFSSPFILRRVEVTEDGMQALVTLAKGDMRKALNILQVKWNPLDSQNGCQTLSPTMHILVDSKADFRRVASCSILNNCYGGGSLSKLLVNLQAFVFISI